MLLRSSSTPILNSWLPSSKDPSLEAETAALQHKRTRPVCFSAADFHFPASRDDPSKEALHLASKTSFHGIPRPVKKNPSPHGFRAVVQSKIAEEKTLTSTSLSSPIERLLSSSGLGGGSVLDKQQTLILGGGNGNGGGGGGSGGGSGSNNHSDGTDACYQKLIEANPGNSLLLGNYARFLKDVQGDLERAEEYCGRAILANPDDGNLLSLYADLIWQNEKNASRAENYYNQAVKTAPDDCYVLASYARFLWDTEEEDEEEGNSDHQERKQQEIERSYVPTPKFFQEASLRPPLAAA